MLGFIQTVVALFSAILALFSTLFPFLTPEKVDMDKFELVWADEFDADSIDETKWQGCHFSKGDTMVRKGGYWNWELMSVQDGNLHISTKYYQNGFNGNSKPGWYSGAIYTKNLFEQKYGYFEVRCILPKGSGMWSAFWLNCNGMANENGSGTDGAELDVFESAYYSDTFKNRVSSNIHYDGYGENLKSQNVTTPFIINNNPYKDFNTYGLEWNENEYIFYINGIETGRSNFGGTSQVPEYLILSVEVGGQNGVAADNWAGPALEKDATTTDFIVDYVRVYQYK